MKYYLAVFLGALASPSVAELQPVVATGGFQAVAHREIETGRGRKGIVYSVLGALSLTIGKDAPLPLSAECLGFDEHGEGFPTVGTGRCVWKDAQGDSIFVTIGTRGDQNTYRVTGGTGKWSRAAGELRTKFTYLPAPEGIFLLHEAGTGRLTPPANK
jgi:hypothetical protein